MNLELPSALRLVSALLSLAAVSRLSTPSPWSFLGASALDIKADRMALERRYTTPHSLGDNYIFDPRDGWQTVNTTNLLYKYQRRAIMKHMGYGADPDDDSRSGDTLPDSQAGKEIRAFTHGTGGMHLAPPKSLSNLSTNGTRRMKLVRRAKKSESGSKAPKSKSKLKSKTKPKSKNSKPATKTNPKKDVLAEATAQTGLLSSFRKVLQSIKPVGQPEPVTITWYAGVLRSIRWFNSAHRRPQVHRTRP